MQFGMIGLGRMGANMVRRLMKAGHKLVVFDRSADAVGGRNTRRRSAASLRASSPPHAREQHTAAGSSPDRSSRSNPRPQTRQDSSDGARRRAATRHARHIRSSSDVVSRVLSVPVAMPPHPPAHGTFGLGTRNPLCRNGFSHTTGARNPLCRNGFRARVT